MSIIDFCLRFPQHAEEVQERAGILEFDGGQDREAAERNSVFLLMAKFSLWNQGDYWRLN